MKRKSKIERKMKPRRSAKEKYIKDEIKNQGKAAGWTTKNSIFFPFNFARFSPA